MTKREKPPPVAYEQTALGAIERLLREMRADIADLKARVTELEAQR